MGKKRREIEKIRKKKKDLSKSVLGFQTRKVDSSLGKRKSKIREDYRERIRVRRGGWGTDLEEGSSLCIMTWRKLTVHSKGSIERTTSYKLRFSMNSSNPYFFAILISFLVCIYKNHLLCVFFSFTI